MSQITRHEVSRAAALSAAVVLIGLLLWGRLLIRNDVPRTAVAGPRVKAGDASNPQKSVEDSPDDRLQQ